MPQGFPTRFFEKLRARDVVARRVTLGQDPQEAAEAATKAYVDALDFYPAGYRSGMDVTGYGGAAAKVRPGLVKASDGANVIQTTAEKTVSLVTPFEWLFNDGSGSAAACAQYASRNGAFAAGPTWGSGYVDANAAYGGSEYLSMPAGYFNFSAQSFTVAWWVTPNTGYMGGASTAVPLGYGGGNNTGWEWSFTLTGGTLRFRGADSLFLPVAGTKYLIVGKFHYIGAGGINVDEIRITSDGVTWTEAFAYGQAAIAANAAHMLRSNPYSTGLNSSGWDATWHRLAIWPGVVTSHEFDQALWTAGSEAAASASALGVINGVAATQLAGTVSSSGTTVTGSGTAFLTDFAAGKPRVITADGISLRVSSVASDTSLTLASAPPVAWSGAIYWRGGPALGVSHHLYAVSNGTAAQDGFVWSPQDVGAGDTLADLPSGYAISRQTLYSALGLSGALVPSVYMGGGPYAPQYEYSMFADNSANCWANILASGSSATFAALSLAATVPVGTVGVRLTIGASTASQLYGRLRTAEERGAGRWIFSTSNAGVFDVAMPLGASRELHYMKVAGSSNFVINVQGYTRRDA